MQVHTKHVTGCDFKQQFKFRGNQHISISAQLQNIVFMKANQEAPQRGANTFSRSTISELSFDTKFSYPESKYIQHSQTSPQSTKELTLRAEKTRGGTVKGKRFGPPAMICFLTVHII